MQMRRAWRAAAILAAVFLSAVPATAQSICVQLESQLQSLQSGQADSQYQQVLGQYNQQQAAYDRLYNSAEQQGCIRLIQRRVPESCGPVLSQLDSAEAALNQLAGQLANAPDPNRRSADVNTVLRALGNNNCGQQYARYADRQQGSLLDRLFGLDRGDSLITIPGPVPETTPTAVASYRTLCVRVCDGSYFPISFSTTEAQFGTDAGVCQARCPGQQVELYVHRSTFETVEQAVSLTGSPYSLLENAFAFRETYNPECGCGPTYTPIPDNAGASLVTIDLARGAGTGLQVAVETYSGPPVPRGRPEPSEDPDTVANRAGGFVPGAFTPPDMNAAVALVNDEGMRLIGPASLFAQ